MQPKENNRALKNDFREYWLPRPSFPYLGQNFKDIW